MDVNVSTRKVERKFVEINGKEFPAGAVIDFIEAVEDTDGFVSGVRCTGRDRDIAEAFEEGRDFWPFSRCGFLREGGS